MNSGEEIFLFDQREESSDLRFADRRIGAQHFFVSAPRLFRTPRRQQCIRLGFADVGWNRVALRSQRLGLAHCFRPPFAVAQREDAVAPETDDEAGVGVSRSARLREQLVEAGQRLIGAFEATARIRRRHIVTPADQFARLIRLHFHRYRVQVARRRHRRPELREHARYCDHRFAVLRLKTKRLPVTPQSSKRSLPRRDA